MDYYLGLDLGTTSIKAAVIQEDGKILSLVKRSNPIQRVSNKARQDVFHLLTLATQLLDQAIAEAKLEPKQICVMGLTTQRESFAFFDHCGISPLFCWQDPTKPKDLKLTKHHKIATLDTLFFFHISDKKLFITDETQASYAQFNDLEAMKAQVLPSFSNFGSYRGIPIKSCLADQPASLYALQHNAVLSLGTGAFALANIDSSMPLPEGVKKYCGVAGPDEQSAYIEFSISCLAPILNTLVLNYAPSRTFGELESFAAGTFHSKGLFYHPTLQALKGFSPTSGVCEWSRAFFEGFVFQIKEIIDALQKTTHSLFPVIPVTGGVSQNNYLIQLLSDLTGVGFYRPKCIETALIGAVQLASSNPLKELVRDERTFNPQINHVLHESYQHWKESFYEV
jgi:glycerol kinase